MKEEIRTNQTKADTTLKEMKELTARLEAEIEAKIIANNEKFEIIQNTLVSHMEPTKSRH
jgi:hypothetical protein